VYENSVEIRPEMSWKMKKEKDLKNGKERGKIVRKSPKKEKK